MSKIYKLSIEEGIDIISYSRLSHEYRLKWLFFDSSVFVDLTNYFINRKSHVLDQDYVDLINFLSTENINIHPLTLIEAARDKDFSELKLKPNRGMEHLYAMLLAQCVDTHTYPLSPGSDWKVSKDRVRLILNEYPFRANSLFMLAEKMFKDMFSKVESTIPSLQFFKDNFVQKFLYAAWEANSKGGSNYEKLVLFFKLIPRRPYLPKIVDFCTRLIVIRNEQLLYGALKKIKKEPDHTALDIAFFEYAQQGNFSEPFPDLKPLNYFFTCDYNLFYYAKLGRPLVINLPNFKQRIYYPDLSFLEKDVKSLRVVRDYFSENCAEDLKEHIIEEIVSDLKNYPATPDTEKFLRKIYREDFSKFTVFQYAAKFKDL